MMKTLSLPVLEFDCRGPEGLAPALREIMQAADRLAPGEAFCVRASDEPVLLCRVLSARGFQHDAEDDGEGGRRVRFTRSAW